jgi:hypothetical protein
VAHAQAADVQRGKTLMVSSRTLRSVLKSSSTGPNSHMRLGPPGIAAVRLALADRLVLVMDRALAGLRSCPRSRE